MTTAIEPKLAEIAELERIGALTPTSFQPPEGMSYEAAVGVFSYFGRVSNALRWAVGDLINWGEGRYGDKVYQAALATGLTEGTLQNYAWVCGQVPDSRRRETLPFSHHEVVARLDADDQVRWLAAAEENNWTRKQLREFVLDEGLLEPVEQPQWSGASGGAAAISAPPLAPMPDTNGPAPIPVTLSPEPGVEIPVLVGVPYARTLAAMRDDLEVQIDVCKAEGAALSGVFEEKRDALNWALERLAPELA